MSDANTARSDAEIAADHARQLARTLGFFSSVIKSGEAWSPTCQDAYDEASAILSEVVRAMEAPPISTEDVKVAIRTQFAFMVGWTDDQFAAIAAALNAARAQHEGK